MNSRNVAGVDDFVLLEDFTNEEVFIDNLRIRYESDLIYVCKIIFNIISDCDH